MSAADETLDRLAQEYVRRLRAGEDVEPEAYADKHPELAERIHELFPVLVLMEGLKPSGGTQAGATLAESKPAAPEVPTRIGPFDVLRELGRGGMGRVYEVHDSRGERRALKVVHPHLLERPGFLARFLREVETGLRVDHPRVVETIESGVAEYEGTEVPYLVLEYVEGTSLRTLLDETGGVSERLAREIGVTVAEALAAVHAAGIVHRDVKPENVVIAPDETVKLMDLGVALVQEEALRLTQTGEFVGSLLYAAPEQLRSGRVDARSDLYGLGLLLFELVAGKHPEADGPGTLLTRRFSGMGPRRLSELAPATTPFLDAVIAVLLASDPDARFANASEVATVLREGEEGAWWRAQEAARARPVRPRAFEDEPAFVGREHELRSLTTAYTEVRGGAGRVVLVVGEGGIGKSRLVSSWLDVRERDEPPPAVAWIQHGPGAGHLGLTPLAESMAALLGDQAEARVHAALGDQAEAAATLLAHLREPAAADEAGGVGRASLEALYRSLLRAIAAESPLVLVVEDLHFASPEVRGWLDRLIPALADDPVLLLATTRPGALDSWIDQTSALELARRIVLDGLAPEVGSALFADALGADLAELAASQDVVRHADGNPFCLIEFARELRARTRATSATPREAPALPASVQHLVEERLAAIPHDVRELLAVAACCGDRFDPVLVCEAAGVPRIAGLRILHAADRLHGALVAEGASYRFVHHLVQEGMHGGLPPALRAAYHTALAAALEARMDEGAAPSDAEAYTIARHYLLGDEPGRAEPYVRAGIEHLLAHSEVRRAARMARRAIEALPKAPPALRARLLNMRARALDGRVDPKEVLQLAEEALAESERVDDPRLRIEMMHGVGAALAKSGRHDLSWPYAERSVALAEELGDPEMLALTLDDLGSVQFDRGDAEAAMATSERVIEIARSSGNALRAARSMITMAAYASESGDLEQGRRRAEIALTTSHIHGDRATERFALGVLSRMALGQCDIPGALTLARRLEAMGREEGNLRVVSSSQLASAHAQFNLGELDAAAESFARCGELFRTMGYREMHVLWSAPTMLMATTGGDFGRAYELGRDALAMLEQVPLPHVGARVHPRMANLLAWMGAGEEAEAQIEIGRAKAREALVLRETFQIEQAAATLPHAQGDLAAAADRYAAHLDVCREQQLTLYTALAALRLGGLAAELGRVEQARESLDLALSIVEAGGLQSAIVEARIWKELLPDGRPEAARVFLEREARLLPHVARIRLGLLLAERLGMPEMRAEARALCEQLIASAPEAYRERMRSEVPLYRDAMG